ncbi:MAG TPA: hypothetical protein VNP89_09845 [Gaiellaceae bacterium]|nr:hypothetical protein [Gaiellaceae bacterium]
MLAVGAAALASVFLFAQTAASSGNIECRYGAISAIGPVDAQGHGDTIPDVRCLEP